MGSLDHLLPSVAGATCGVAAAGRADPRLRPSTHDSASPRPGRRPRGPEAASIAASGISSETWRWREPVDPERSQRREIGYVISSSRRSRRGGHAAAADLAGRPSALPFAEVGVLIGCAGPSPWGTNQMARGYIVSGPRPRRRSSVGTLRVRRGRAHRATAPSGTREPRPGRRTPQRRGWPRRRPRRPGRRPGTRRTPRAGASAFSRPHCPRT